MHVWVNSRSGWVEHGSLRSSSKRAEWVADLLRRRMGWEAVSGPIPPAPRHPRSDAPTAEVATKSPAPVHGAGASAHWSRVEIEAIVSDYFAMLERELAGIPLNKSERRRALAQELHDRSPGSIEFKHANISAVLLELGLPYVAGYKPRSNYQKLLADVVADRVSNAQGLLEHIALDADATVEMPNLGDPLAALVNPPPPPEPKPPLRELSTGPYELPAPRPLINYLEREASNRQLGAAGELFVMRFEQARLQRAGKARLAGKVEHISLSYGDGAGYDILSFEETGKDRLIEVKTTKYGRETPFFVSRNEVDVSRATADRYHLYRCFGFRKQPQLFTLAGALPVTCMLEPAAYRATVA